eukprot:Pgem_evm1s16833
MAKKQKLASYVLLPVQRIPRYSMLLEQLAKNTPESENAHGELKSMLHSINEVCSVINEYVDEQ